jgi:hypothetical protein
MYLMNVKKTVFALLFASAFGAASVPAMADVVVGSRRLRTDTKSCRRRDTAMCG